MRVTLLGSDARLTAFDADGRLGVDVPFISPDAMQSHDLYTFRFTREHHNTSIRGNL